MRQRLKSKDLDLLVAYKKKKEPSKYTSLMKFILPPGVLAIIIICLFVYFTVDNNRLESKIDDKKGEIEVLEEKIANDPDVLKNNTLLGILDNTRNYKEIYELIKSYPTLTQAIFDQITIAANVSIKVNSLSYVSDTEAITLSIESPNASDAEQFVRRLKELDVFGSVLYSGYTSSEKESENTESNSSTNNATQKTEAPVVYTATVQCTLKR